MLSVLVTCVCVCVFDAVVVIYLDINLREKIINNKWENLCGKSNIDYTFFRFSFIHSTVFASQTCCCCCCFCDNDDEKIITLNTCIIIEKSHPYVEQHNKIQTINYLKCNKVYASLIYNSC